MRRPALMLLAIWLIAWTRAGRAQELPLFDAHIHYSQSAWGELAPAQALALLEAAGVGWALVSSTPDDGTLKLHALAPQRIVPFLRPYRTPADMGGWAHDPEVQAYVAAGLQKGIYRGIGEFHLSQAAVAAPVVQYCARVAAAQRLFLHAHVDATTAAALLERYPEVRLLWAHAGMSAPPAVVGELLARFPQLWVELSLRHDVAPQGQLDPAWRDLFLRHADRFLVGTDTWVPWRWQALGAEAQATRRWLAQLPPAVAARIAYQNGLALFVPAK
ncbi:MAG: hypothetical protein KatS3mg131_3204 [Candidatus Tectimicrobiota bacterium]|nr:MAG: hypothetical protein KatS3mg131_3204 [Candidatus Tectomicrobia bacterium]